MAPTPYLARPEYEQRINALVDSGHRVISLVGDYGVGKSRLAKHMAEQLTRGHGYRVVLDARRPATLHRDIEDFLSELGFDPAQEGVDTTAAVLAALRRVGGRSVMVLDGVQDWSVVEALMPAPSPTIALVTGEVEVMPKGLGEECHVDPMSPDESRQMLDYLLREVDIGAGELDWLNTFLSGRPLAIEHACAQLQNSKVLTPLKLIAQLKRDATLALKPRGRDEHVALPALYNAVIAELRESAPHILTLLEIFSVLELALIPVELLRTTYATRVENQHNPAMTVDFAFADAIEFLRSRQLIRVSKYVTMHDLTQKIIGDLLRASWDDAGRAVIDAFWDFAGDDVDPATILSPDQLIWAPHVACAVISLTYLDEGEREELGLGHLVAILCRGFDQKGESPLKSTLLWNFRTLAGGRHDNWLADLDGIEAYLALVNFGYNEGHMTRSAYVDELVKIVEAAMSPGMESERASQIMTTCYLDSLALDYSYDQLERPLQAVLSIGEKHWYDADYRGGLLLRAGDILLRQARWDEAGQAFMSAYFVYEKMEGVVGARGRIRGLCGLAWLAMMSNNEATLKADYRELMLTHLKHFHPTYDCVVSAEWAHACAVLGSHASIWLHALIDHPRIEGPKGALKQAKALYRMLMSERQVLAVEYDLICYEVALTRRSVPYDQVQGLAEKAAALREDELMLRFNLLSLRMMLIGNSLTEDCIERCLDLADNFSEYFVSPYWHAEALATAYLLSCRTQPYYSLTELRESLHVVMKKMGRTHRLQVIEGIATGDADITAILAY